MLRREALREQAVLFTENLRLEQMGPARLEDVWASLSDRESLRLTGTHAEFTLDAVRSFVSGLPGCDDRADWAIVRVSDGAYVGEIVLNELDEGNGSMNFRIMLILRGQGYGTESTKAVLEYAFSEIGLHRINLGVYAFNPRAIRVYEKCGFVREGVQRDSLLWDGQWVDRIDMGILATDPR